MPVRCANKLCCIHGVRAELNETPPMDIGKQSHTRNCFKNVHSYSVIFFAGDR